MTFIIDTSIPWIDHFVQYGFAVLRNQVSREFIDRCLAQLRTHVEGEGKDLPFDEWTVDNVKLRADSKAPGDPVFDTVYDQPNIRHIMDTMFGQSEVGHPEGWSGVPAYRIFLTAHDPKYKPKTLWGGHIDFGGNIIPVFGDAFVIQVALHETEPFGGNITVIPGSHKLVQQRAIENPLTQYPYDFGDYPFTEPYEFVAQPGDVFIMHHLCFHSGNKCATYKPRLALHCQAQRSTFLTVADPDNPNNSPWVKSFTLNGRYEDPEDQFRYTIFNAAKTAMWGYWTSEDGATEYRVSTYADGALRVRVTLPGVPVHTSRGHRFDGTQLTFEQNLADGTAPAVMQLDASDRELMNVHVEPLDGAAIEFQLRRTGIITGRIVD